jgi:hypothetical protein
MVMFLSSVSGIQPALEIEEQRARANNGRIDRDPDFGLPVGYGDGYPQVFMGELVLLSVAGGSDAPSRMRWRNDAGWAYAGSNALALLGFAFALDGHRPKAIEATCRINSPQKKVNLLMQPTGLWRAPAPYSKPNSCPGRLPRA